MKPYEEIDFPNGFLRWIREDGMYVCSMTEEQMVKIKALHEAPRTWVGLTEDEAFACQGRDYFETYKAIEAKLKEKNT
jgi:glutamyl/glutaminyl-tRNA synthetase